MENYELCTTQNVFNLKLFYVDRLVDTKKYTIFAANFEEKYTCL